MKINLVIPTISGYGLSGHMERIYKKKDVLQAVAVLSVDAEIKVENDNVRKTALNAARILRRLRKIEWVAHSWKNQDGSYTVRAVKP